MDGILNLNKPRGWTSHDVVARVRRLTRVRRVGHAGTLDPMATGVLLVCLGRATRITEYLMGDRKRYRTVVRLGISTESHDADGKITTTAPVKVTRVNVEEALSAFRGRIEQVPPMVSAVKRNGQPLYRLARRGIAVERDARIVEIHELTLTEWHSPSFSLELSCSKGTYVRAIARDLGEALGCGAHLTELTRLASGDFTLDQSLELDEFAAAVASSEGAEAPHAAENRELPGPIWQDLVLPIDAGLKRFPSSILGAQDSRRVRTGQPLPAERVEAPQEQLCRAYVSSDTGDHLIALLKFDDKTGVWRPHKVFRPL